MKEAGYFINSHAMPHTDQLSPTPERFECCAADCVCSIFSVALNVLTVPPTFPVLASTIRTLAKPELI